VLGDRFAGEHAHAVDLAFAEMSFDEQHED
jgi:hypothetical protein